MFKKTIVLALAALAVLAVSAPAASADWYKHHKIIQQNEQLELTGQTKFQSLVVGTIDCQVHVKLQLLAGQTTSRIEEYALDETTGKTPTELCTTGGPLAQCDVTDLITDATTQAPWTAHLLQNKDTIEVTTGVKQYLLEHNSSTPNTHHACNVVQQIQLKPGKVHWTIAPGETCTINKVTKSGQLETSFGAKVTISGTLSLIPGATYGTLCP